MTKESSIWISIKIEPHSQSGKCYVLIYSVLSHGQKRTLLSVLTLPAPSNSGHFQLVLATLRQLMERYEDGIANEQQSPAEREQGSGESDGDEHLQLSTLSSNWCLTASKAVVCPFLWAIENFSFYLGKDDTATHRSTRFADPLAGQREWYLSMESRKKTDRERQTLFTIRMLSNEVGTTLKGKIHFSFLDSLGKILIDKGKLL